MSLEEICQQCGKTISRRAKANIWQGEKIVCTSCLHDLEGAVRRHEASIRLAGRPHTPWLVHDGKRQHGPYTTAQLIALLDSEKVDRRWNIWREGMSDWVPAGMLFTLPFASGGRTQLRDHGQGDGTYRFADHINDTI